MRKKKDKKLPAIVFMILLAFVPLLMVLGNAVLIPILPDMQTRLQVSKFQISLFITLFSVPAGLTIPFTGVLSDKIPRKWIIIPGLILFGTGGVMAGLFAMWVTKPYVWILCARIIQGIGAAGTAPIAMAEVADLFEGKLRSRALGINEGGNAFGKVCSPIIGSLVALISWVAVFFVFPILCVPLAIALWFFLPSDGNKKNADSMSTYRKSFFEIVRQKGRWLSVAYLSGATALFTLFGVLFYLSDLLETKYHLNGIYRGLLLAIPLLVLTLTSLAIGVIVKNRIQLMKWLLVIGLLIMAVMLFCASFVANQPWVLIGCMGLTAIGTGMVLPCLNTLITSATDEAQRGIVTSIYGSVRFIGVAAGPPIFTWLLVISVQIMFWSVTCLALFCSILCFFIINKTKLSGNVEDRKFIKNNNSGGTRV